MYATWLADVLRHAGLKVLEHDGWETRGHYGGFHDLLGVVWHHDASATGDSPNGPRGMLKNWDTNSAQLWVSRQGVWHVLAAGPAYHAGKVRFGSLGNHTSLGIETDHTTGERWPRSQLESLRTGTAAILTRLRVQPDRGLAFHRTVCDPPGRKIDPDGLILELEQDIVAALMARPQEDNMRDVQVIVQIGAGKFLTDLLTGRRGIGNPAEEKALKAIGIKEVDLPESFTADIPVLPSTPPKPKADQ